MAKICKNCATYNSDMAMLCKDCGKPIGKQPSKTDQKLTIAAISIILILCAGYSFYCEGIFDSPLELESQDFEVFTMDAPVGSEFNDTESIPYYVPGGEISVENVGDYSYEVSAVGISDMGIDDILLEDMELITTIGDVDVYQDVNGNDFYLLTRHIGEYDFFLMGSDPDTMLNMINSVELK